MLSRVRTRVGVGEAGAAAGKVAPAWREYRGAPGRGVRERASLRLPALQRPRQGSGGRAGSRGRAVQMGGLGRPCRLPGPRAEPGETERRVCASDRAKPGSRQASPVRTGKPRQRWRARGRPEGSGVVQLGPLATSPSGRATWCGLRGGASLPRLRLCEGRVAAVVANPNGQPLRRLGSRVPCLQRAAHTVRSYRRGSLVLSNPIFAGAQEGTAWHIKRKVIKASRFSCVNPTSCNSRQ